MLNGQNPVGKVSGNPRIDTTSMEEIEGDTPEIYKMWLEDAFKDQEFHEDTNEMLKEWERRVEAAGIDPSTVLVHMTGESHLDMAYRWRYEQTRKKAQRTLAKAVFHAERFPQFTFIVSSPQIMAWIKEDNVTLFTRIKDCVSRGQIELVGGSWVEADCMMPSGEAFVRQRLQGMKLLRDEFGEDKLPSAEWYPDTFGYNAGLPQILSKSGATCFFTSKLDWNKEHDLPLVHFHWESPDGSRVLATNARSNFNVFNAFPRYGKYRHLLKDGAKKEWSYQDNFADLAASLDPTSWATPIGFFYGAGDGGHGPTHRQVAEMLSFVQNVDSGNTRLQFKWSSLHEYFDDVRRFADRLPTWKDELYLEYHRGTFSVHPAIKRWNRKLESLLLGTETAATLVSVANPVYEYPREHLEKLWRAILLNQFHDVLPGSCIPEVLDDLVGIWEQVEREATGILAGALSRVGLAGKSLRIFNTRPVAYRGPVFLPACLHDTSVMLDDTGCPPPVVLVLSCGTHITCQPVPAEPVDLADTRPAGWWAVVELGPHEVTGGDLVIGVSKDDTTRAMDHAVPRAHVVDGIPMIENNGMHVELEPGTGAIAVLQVRGINGGRNLLDGTGNNLATVFEGAQDEYAAWNLKPGYWKNPLGTTTAGAARVTVEASGPVFATLRVEHELLGSPVVQTITVFEGDPFLHCTWHSDWSVPDVDVRISLHPATGAVAVVSDQMYCAVRRNVRPLTDGDEGRWEQPMQKYVDSSTPGNEWGLALVNEGKHAYDTIDGGIRFIVHRSPVYPLPAPESWASRERMARAQVDGTKPPVHAGLHATSSRYAVFPHAGGALVDSLGKPAPVVKIAAESYNSPPIVVQAVTEQETCHADSILGATTPGHVIVTALKREEWNGTGDIILRVAEVAGSPALDATITLQPAIAARVKAVKAVDLLEREILDHGVTWDAGGGAIHARFGAFEVRTFAIKIQ